MRQFRLLDRLPPYVFASADAAKRELQSAGVDVIDLGFGNPDIPSPAAAVDTLVSAAAVPASHRYASSRGESELRSAIAARYARRFGVHLDPETQVVATIGMKEGFMNLMRVLVGPGDTAIIPEPAYPMHRFGPVLAGAGVIGVPVDDDPVPKIRSAFSQASPRPAVVVLSFPHNPTTACVDVGVFTDLVAFAQETGVVLVHDFAYADVSFDGYSPPSLLQVPGASEVGVELFSMTKGHSMAGWRVGFVLGNAEIVSALTRLKAYLDYGMFSPVQAAAAAALDSGDGFVAEVNAIYEQRRDVLVDSFAAAGWKMDRPRGTMFVWARIPQRYRHLSSAEFASLLLERAHVAVTPGSGFGPSGEGFVRFALVEPSERLAAAAAAYAKAM